MKNCKIFRTLSEALETQPEPFEGSPFVGSPFVGSPYVSSPIYNINNNNIKTNNKNLVSIKVKISNVFDSGTDEDESDDYYDENDPINTIQSLIS